MSGKPHQKVMELSLRKWYQPKLTVRVRHLAAINTLRHAAVKSLVQ